MNTCSTCKHWKDPSDMPKCVGAWDKEERVCEVLINNVHHCTSGDDILGCGCCNVSDSDQYIRTPPGFGCIHHQPLP